jgi:acetylornithine deacetylase/succinyl-diaminopimelate desuccinylase-like protein
VVRELAEFLALPNLASDADGIRRNAVHAQALLERRGVIARLLESPGSPPAVYGELTVPGARRTVMVYAHYDGQPVDAAAWATPPWTPTLRAGVLEDGAAAVDLASPGAFGPEWRLYGRSASDDKAPIVAAAAALDALRAGGRAPSVNLKFFLEGEEEAGSPHLRAMLEAHRDLLRADLWLLCDGPVHQTRRPLVYFGVRGVTGVELTLYGPARALHSGHYGNWAPNPAVELARLVASLRDDAGRILVAGFDDDVRPLTDAERAALRSVPPVEDDLRASLALGRTESAVLAEAILRPALNVRGLASGRVGDAAANAIPTEARASIDFRLVPDQTPERVRAQLEAHLRGLGYHVVHEPPDAATRRAHERLVLLEWGAGYPAARTPLDHPAAQALVRVLEQGGTPVVRLPTLGGSVPMHVFGEVLGAPVVGLPIVNHDNNQHAANENLRVQNLWDGIETFAVVFARLGEAWPR